MTRTVNAAATPSNGGRLAIRVRELGRYFGPSVETDGLERPREAFRALMRVTGIELKAPAGQSQVTYPAAGHVLRSVTFDVSWGDVVCLSGASGSGKSVLLRILARQLSPTSGSAALYGESTALLSVGDDLDTQYTAHENLLTAQQAVRRRSPDVADHYLEDVIEFAELRGFEHVAIRTYSTGMVLRLGMALTLCAPAPILLIDQVLGVGDIGFQQKCVDRILALKHAGHTILMVLDEEDLVQQLATRVITLGDGRVIGDSALGQRSTIRRVQADADVAWEVLRALPEDDLMLLRSIEVQAGRDVAGTFLEITAIFEAKVDRAQWRPFVFLRVDGRTKPVLRSLYPEFVSLIPARATGFTVRIPLNILPNGQYTIAFNIASSDGSYTMKATDAVSFTVRRPGAAAADDASGSEQEVRPLLHVDMPWEVERVLVETA